MALRSALFRLGLRFWVDRTLVKGLRRKADIVFPRARVAVFVDGCFWHGCPDHGTWPKANAAWWRAKIEANRRRDRDTDLRLAKDDWIIIRVWEHEAPSDAATRVAAAVRASQREVSRGARQSGNHEYAVGARADRRRHEL